MLWSIRSLVSHVPNQSHPGSQHQGLLALVILRVPLLTPTGRISERQAMWKIRYRLENLVNNSSHAYLSYFGFRRFAAQVVLHGPNADELLTFVEIALAGIKVRKDIFVRRGGSIARLERYNLSTDVGSDEDVRAIDDVIDYSVGC